MKLPRSSLIWFVLIVCLTLFIFTYLTRKSLCEIRNKDGCTEVATFMADTANALKRLYKRGFRFTGSSFFTTRQ
ncbi:TPA: type I toxin-antitoxin system Hok family toxin [Escherichia coli]|nr:type I toxin-antitoxin system Hok family toxin [Escherichia coli]HCQ9034701.1 type I toxin-antitoxin system Hok family toxin [Escherichia coli]